MESERFHAWSDEEYGDVIAARKTRGKAVEGSKSGQKEREFGAKHGFKNKLQTFFLRVFKK